MRTCGNCGQSGHNKRTCPSRVEAVSDTPAPKQPSISDGLDEETREAIDWYMEKQYPGYLERRKAKLLRPDHEPDDQD